MAAPGLHPFGTYIRLSHLRQRGAFRVGAPFPAGCGDTALTSNGPEVAAGFTLQGVYDAKE